MRKSLRLSRESTRRLSTKNSPSFKTQFPENAFIGAVIRRERLIIPTGQSVIQPADRVIVFSMPGAIPIVEDLFAERRA